VSFLIFQRALRMPVLCSLILFFVVFQPQYDGPSPQGHAARRLSCVSGAGLSRMHRAWISSRESYSGFSVLLRNTALGTEGNALSESHPDSRGGPSSGAAPSQTLPQPPEF